MSLVIEALKRLKLPPEDFVVVGSGILDALAIRRANDVDIVVSEQTFEKLKKSGWQQINKPEGIALQNEIFEAGISWNNKDPNFQGLLERATIIKGYNFAKLEDVLEWKKKKGRPKDIKDAKLIIKYYKKEGRAGAVR